MESILRLGFSFVKIAPYLESQKQTQIDLFPRNKSIQFIPNWNFKSRVKLFGKWSRSYRYFPRFLLASPWNFCLYPNFRNVTQTWKLWFIDFLSFPVTLICEIRLTLLRIMNTYMQYNEKRKQKNKLKY